MEPPTALQDVITRVVRVLLVLNGGQQKDLAGVIGLHASGVTRRMTRGGWTIEDLDAMARYFKVPITTFFEDPSTMFDQGKPDPSCIADCPPLVQVTDEY